MTVRTPYQVEPISTTQAGFLLCSGGQGNYRQVTNQLQYQDGSGVLVAGIAMQDSISFTSRNDLHLIPNPGPATTDSNGSWQDFYSVCTTYCPSSGESDAIQSWTWNSAGLPHTNLVVYKCSSITIDGF